MNNTFNLKRFSWYFKKFSLEHARTYLLSLVVAVGIIFLALEYPSFESHQVPEGWQLVVFSTFIWLGGSIFTSTIFAEFGNKKRAVLPLTLPVSHFEKFLVTWLYTFPIFLIVGVCAFYAVDALVLSMNHPVFGASPNKMLDLTGFNTPSLMLLFAFVVLHVISFLGAIYFSKQHFVRTAFLFFIAAFAMTTVNETILSIITNGALSQQSMLFQPTVMIKKVSTSLKLNASVEMVNWIVFAAVVALLWASTYYKLKEKQV